MAVKREAEKEILKLMLQDVPTEEIAKRLNYSVGTIRKVFEELREKYNANTRYFCGYKPFYNSQKG